MHASVAEKISTSRIAPVDAARGCAMLMVFLSHTKQHFEHSAPDLHWLLLSSTRIATPAFLLLSGFVIRHVLSTDRRGEASVTLIDRALFLLIVAHVLLGLDSLPEMGLTNWLVSRTVITDAVGVALLFAVLLRRATRGIYLTLGITLYLLSWIAASTLNLDEPWSQWLGAVLFQWRGAADQPEIDVPLVACVGMFLIGMGLHAQLERPLLAGDQPFIANRLFRYGSVSVVAALLGVLTWHLAKGALPDVAANADTAEHVRAFLDPRGKRPPSPAYFAFYGGLSVLMLAVFFYGRPTVLIAPVRSWSAVIGRASLMCFIVQDWLFFLLPKLLRLDEIHSRMFWFTWLAAAIAALYGLAWSWGRLRGNRMLTMGVKGIVHRRMANTHPAA